MVSVAWAARAGVAVAVGVGVSVAVGMGVSVGGGVGVKIGNFGSIENRPLGVTGSMPHEPRNQSPVQLPTNLRVTADP
jgi:hypothetical protein